MQIADINN